MGPVAPVEPVKPTGRRSCEQIVVVVIIVIETIIAIGVKSFVHENLIFTFHHLQCVKKG